MNNTEAFLNELLLKAIKNILAKIHNDKLRLLCEAYAEQIVSELVKQLDEGELNFSELPVALPAEAEKELEEIATHTVYTVFDTVASRLPDGKVKVLFLSDIRTMAANGVVAVISNEDWRQVLQEKLKQYSVGYAKDVSHEAITKAKEYLPETQYSALLCNNAEELAGNIIEAVADGNDVDALLDQVVWEAEEYAKRNVKELTARQVNKAIDEAVDYMADKARDKRRGKYRSRYNKKIKLYTESVRSTLKDNAGLAVARVLDGEDFEAIASDYAINSTKKIASDILVDQSKDATLRLVKSGAKQLHTSGKGSRRVNKRIDQAAGVVSDSLTSNVSSNVVAVISGEKDLDEAAKDVVVDTAKDSACRYMEEHGAELAKEAIETITKKVASKVGNKAVSAAITKAGTSLANVNTVTAVAGAVYDIGKSFKDFLNGDITKAQLLRQIGEKGSAACLSTVYASIGATVGAVGGPIGMAIGAAIGSMVGYVASSMLYGSVLQAFEAEEAAKARAEQTHAFCEEAIKRMRAEREAFEKQAEFIFKKREAAVIQGFRQIDSALLENDFDKFSRGLNAITGSFGHKLQFTNFEEFDSFMQSDEALDL